jgi:hypothetical protein
MGHIPLLTVYTAAFIVLAQALLRNNTTLSVEFDNSPSPPFHHITVAVGILLYASILSMDFSRIKHRG